MKRNMGVADRIVRVLVAIAIAALYVTHIITGTWAVVLMVVAGIFLLTSIAGFCPLYAVLGISTCATGKKAGV